MTDKEFLAGADAETKSPFGGCISILEGMIDNGALDRWNDEVEARFETAKSIADRNAGVPVVVIFADGAFVIVGEADALIMAQCEPEYLTHIPATALRAAINKAFN